MPFGSLFDLGLRIHTDGLEDAKKAFAVVGKGGDEIVRASKAQQKEINNSTNLLKQMAAAVDRNDKKALADLVKLAAEQKAWTIAIGGTASQMLRVAAAERTIKDMAENANKSALAFGKLKGALASIGIGLSIAGVAGFLKGTITEARDAQDKLSQLKVAVDNTGASFDTLKPAFDAAADGLEKVTRFSDEAARGALTTLVTISGSVSGSLKNLGVTADLAAFKHIDLNEAALLVGKAMNGNVTALKKLGISVTAGGDAIGELSKKVHGFATTDAQTLTGALDQTKNAWDDVKEAIGNVIIGTGTITGKTNSLRDALVSLKTYIEENTDKWRGWAANMLDPKWGPANILNHIADQANKAGLALHGLITGDFSKLEDFSDVTGGSSASSGDNIAAQIIRAKAGKPTSGNSGGSGKNVGTLSPLPTEPHVGITPSNAGDGAQFPGLGGPLATLPESLAKTPEIINESGRRAVEAMTQLQSDMQNAIGSLSQILGDGIYNAFAAAFNGEGIGGVFKAFGKTVLAGIGSIFQQMGQAYLSYGIIMAGLVPSLANPFTSGPAAIAIGALLTALGGALGAIAGGHSRGAAGASNTGRNFGSGGSQTTTIKFVNRDGSTIDNLRPVQPLHVTIIGANDPTVNRQLSQMLDNHARR